MKESDSESSLKAAQLAAAKVNAMLVASGRLKLSDLNKNKVKNKSSEVFVEEVVINDAPMSARNYLTRSSTQEDISKMSGAAVSTKGRYLTAEEKLHFGSDPNNRPLYLHIQGFKQQDVKVAVGRIMHIIMEHSHRSNQSCNKHKPHRNSNATLSRTNRNGPPDMTEHQQLTIYESPNVFKEKVFLPALNFPIDLNSIRDRLLGENNANVRYIKDETGAALMIRGIGSGYLEPDTGMEAQEDIHFFLEHNNQDKFVEAKNLLINLVQTIIIEMQEEQQSRQQLQTQVPIFTQPPPSQPPAVDIALGSLNIHVASPPQLGNTAVLQAPLIPPPSHMSTVTQAPLDTSQLRAHGPPLVAPPHVAPPPLIANAISRNDIVVSPQVIQAGPVSASTVITQPMAELVQGTAVSASHMVHIASSGAGSSGTSSSHQLVQTTTGPQIVQLPLGTQIVNTPDGPRLVALVTSTTPSVIGSVSAAPETVFTSAQYSGTSVATVDSNTLQGPSRVSIASIPSNNDCYAQISRQVSVPVGFNTGGSVDAIVSSAHLEGTSEVIPQCNVSSSVVPFVLPPPPINPGIVTYPSSASRPLLMGGCVTSGTEVQVSYTNPQIAIPTFVGRAPQASGQVSLVATVDNFGNQEELKQDRSADKSASFEHQWEQFQQHIKESERQDYLVARGEEIARGTMHDSHEMFRPAGSGLLVGNDASAGTSYPWVQYPHSERPSEYIGGSLGMPYSDVPDPGVANLSSVPAPFPCGSTQGPSRMCLESTERVMKRPRLYNPKDDWRSHSAYHIPGEQKRTDWMPYNSWNNGCSRSNNRHFNKACGSSRIA